MARGDIEVDYLVVGAGATGMAFTDALIAASDDATVAIVDRRDAAGGHWNDAYPFVRLHQPSSYYGVGSLPLGSGSIDRVGPNRGFYECASGAEISGHFDRAMQRLQSTGRVEFLPLSDYALDADGTHRVVTRASGASRAVRVRRKLVDAAYMENSVPATHTRTFEVAEGVDCRPLGELSGLEGPRTRYVVLGGGKTAMDACLWLLDHGVSPERIRWVRPRDAWLLDRKYSQPGEQFAVMFEGLARQSEAAAAAESIGDLFERLEASGQLLRLDPEVEPTMYRCATVDARELPLLRSIRDVVRMGRVRKLERERVVLADGSVEASPDDLYVDCTAVAFETRPSKPIFEADRITVQPVRTCQPCFNAALVGHLEATRDDIEGNNRLCTPNPYPRAPMDWVRMFLTGNMNEFNLSRDQGLRPFMKGTRLNLTHGLAAYRDDPELAAARERVFAAMPAALENLGRLYAEHQASSSA